MAGKKQKNKQNSSKRAQREQELLAREVDHWVEAPTGVSQAVLNILRRPEIKGLMVEALKPYRIEPNEVRVHFYTPVYDDGLGR
jgi:hypothetical protein